jgi:hypothetical protein
MPAKRPADRRESACARLGLSGNVAASELQQHTHVLAANAVLGTDGR